MDVNVNEIAMNPFLKEHSGEFLILAMTALLLLGLLIALPQFVRASMRKAEMFHLERIKSIEKGLPAAPMEDDRSRQAGRTAMIVPTVVMISAATVTSFLVIYKAESLFAVALSIWIVAGTVSLAAITGGVALIGRLAQIQAGDKEEEEEDMPESSFRN